MKLSTDFTKAKVGDGVWCEEYGYGIVDCFTGPVNCVFRIDGVITYITINFEGIRTSSSNRTQFYLLPEYPNKVKKTIECWVNLYPDGGSRWHSSKEDADIYASTRRIGEAEHIIKEYWEDEE